MLLSSSFFRFLEVKVNFLKFHHKSSEKYWIFQFHSLFATFKSTKSVNIPMMRVTYMDKSLRG